MNSSLQNTAPSAGGLFQSDRFQLLRPVITERVVELAHMRVFGGLKFFKGHSLTVPDSLPVVKAALLVAYEMNPVEDFQEEEEALMRGVCSKTLRARRKAKEVKPL